jgi:hypothetical protein
VAKASRTPQKENKSPPIPKNALVHSVSFDTKAMYKGRKEIINSDGM